jgi:hypothetical protein
MCGHGLIGLVALSRLQRPGELEAASPAETHLARLGAEIKATAEGEDLTQATRATPIAPLATGEHRLPRLPSADAA